MSGFGHINCQLWVPTHGVDFQVQSERKWLVISIAFVLLMHSTSCRQVDVVGCRVCTWEALMTEFLLVACRVPSSTTNASLQRRSLKLGIDSTSLSVTYVCVVFSSGVLPSPVTLAMTCHVSGFPRPGTTP